MWLILLVCIVLIGSLVAVGLAITKIRKNSKDQKNSPEITTNAKVIKAYANDQGILTVDSANAKTTSVYYIDFLLEDESNKTFKVNKRLFLSVSDGDKGILKFKGNKVIEFQKQ